MSRLRSETKVAYHARHKRLNSKLDHAADTTSQECSKQKFTYMEVRKVIGCESFGSLKKFAGCEFGRMSSDLEERRRLKGKVELFSIRKIHLKFHCNLGENSPVANVDVRISSEGK